MFFNIKIMIANFIMGKIINPLTNVPRSPVLRRPSEYDMDYEDVFFSSLDGTVLDGWFMSAKWKAKWVVICNHFSPGNRYGYAGHIKPWKNAGGFEVNFLPKYKALVEAWYSVFAYDLRGHWFSAPAQNGRYNPELFEWRDIVGSLRYVRSRKDCTDINIHLHSMCLWGDSTLVAMKKSPEDFKRINSMLLLQPISWAAIQKKLSKNLHLGKKWEVAFEKQYIQQTGFRIEDSSPILDAEHVKIPTFVVQVKNDKMTYPEDVQAVFDAIPVEDKKLFWIEGTTLRFKWYTYFSEHPEAMIEWYDTHNK